MRYLLSLVVPGILLTVCVGSWAQTPTYNRGRTPTEEEIRAWNIDIDVEGKGLPPGSGTAQDGAKLFAQKCAVCHGPTAEGGLAKRLLGGKGSLTSNKPIKTIGSFWPYATTLWDFINRAMPASQPGSLRPDEVYALTAFLLFRNEVIQEGDVMDAKTLPKIQMPNRNGFVPARLEDIPDLRKRVCRVGTCP